MQANPDPCACTLSAVMSLTLVHHAFGRPGGGLGRNPAVRSLCEKAGILRRMRQKAHAATAAQLDTWSKRACARNVHRQLLAQQPLSLSDAISRVHRTSVGGCSSGFMAGASASSDDFRAT